jgi:hypothetical protein
LTTVLECGSFATILGVERQWVMGGMKKNTTQISPIFVTKVMDYGFL